MDRTRGLGAGGSATATQFKDVNAVATKTARGDEPAAPTSKIDRRWSDFANGQRSLPTRARIASFGSPLTDSSGFTNFRWTKPKDAIPFEMRVDVSSGDPDRVMAQIWTNADNNARPSDFYPVEMKRASSNGNQLTFKLDLPIERVGNYRAVGRISTDGGKSWTWISSSGIGDTIFRVRAAEHEAINLAEVHIGMANYDYDGKAAKFATIEDFTDGGYGAYNLEGLAAQGKNMV
jgi:hypothetical protein